MFSSTRSNQPCLSRASRSRSSQLPSPLGHDLCQPAPEAQSKVVIALPTATRMNSRVSVGRTKRGLEASPQHRDALRPKRARTAVEIFDKPQPVVRDTTGRSAPRAGSSAGRANLPTTSPADSTPSVQASRVPNEGAETSHQKKVRRGIQHELALLQPSGTDAKESGGRKLRSKEATRFKSELSSYFPEYDEVIGNDPKEQHLLTYDTPIVITGLPDIHTGQLPGTYEIHGYGDALFTDVYDAQRIDFSFLDSQHTFSEDPLPDSSFMAVHKRAERMERSIRNAERGRAQHEKNQVVRILGSLQGHDWLRVMGITAVTDSKRKSFEPAREYFIRGCRAILDKFENWTMEEKRRKLQKDKARAAEADGGDSDDDLSTTEPADEDESSHTGSSDASSPAKQLQEEALAHSKSTSLGVKRQRTSTFIHPSEPLKEFTSFFNKRYERDAALSKRRAGRKSLAFGLPVPDMEEHDFNLPEQYRDEETMKSRARKKRKERRESRARK